MSARLDLDLRPLRYAGAAMLALGLALPRIPGNPGLPCPLRTMTGVPCPFCGLTTSVKATVGGHLWTALAANPAGLVIVVAAVVLLLRPHLQQFWLPAPAVTTAVALSWLFELHRFHFL